MDLQTQFYCERRRHFLFQKSKRTILRLDKKTDVTQDSLKIR